MYCCCRRCRRRRRCCRGRGRGHFRHFFRLFLVFIPFYALLFHRFDLIFFVAAAFREACVCVFNLIEAETLQVEYKIKVRFALVVTNRVGCSLLLLLFYILFIYFFMPIEFRPPLCPSWARTIRLRTNSV